MSLYLKFSNLLRTIRDYFYRTEAIEVSTDILQKYPNLDNNIYPVEVSVFNEKGERLKRYLHTSPEYQMKKILAREKRDIFQITKVFRNYEGSFKHKIEFNMLEWYRVGYRLEDLIRDTHLLFIEVIGALNRSPLFEFRGRTYDIRDYELITVEEAFKKFTGIELYSVKQMNEFLKEKEETFKPKEDWEELFFHIYAFYIEPFLGRERLTFIYDYPPELSALAKIEDGKGKRFEAYIGGIELVNGYYEETEPEEIKRRLERDVRKKKKETGKFFEIDKDFLKAIEEMPECSGASLGIDRLFMIVGNLENIHYFDRKI